MASSVVLGRIHNKISFKNNRFLNNNKNWFLIFDWSLPDLCLIVAEENLFTLFWSFNQPSTSPVSERRASCPCPSSAISRLHKSAFISFSPFLLRSFLLQSNKITHATDKAHSLLLKALHAPSFWTLLPSVSYVQKKEAQNCKVCKVLLNPEKEHSYSHNFFLMVVVGYFFCSLPNTWHTNSLPRLPPILRGKCNLASHSSHLQFPCHRLQKM